MEQTSNGGVENTPKVDGEKEVVMEDPAALTVQVVDGEDDSSSSSSCSGEEAEPEGKNLQDQVLVSDTVVESVELEHEVSLTEESNKDIQQSEAEEENSSSLDNTYEDSPILTDLSANGLEETEQLSSVETAEAKGVEEEETNASTVAEDVVSKGIEETTISCADENRVLPAAEVSQGKTETAIPAASNDPGNPSDSQGSKENVTDSSVEDSMEAENVPTVDSRDAGEPVNKPEIDESTGNQPIVSLSNHPVQPTSWRSCCGLFEVLRRSDR